MLIQIIKDNAEQECIEALEKTNKSSINRNLLQCRFHDVSLKPDPDHILHLVKDILSDKHACLFFCDDGDIFIRWNGYPKEVIEKITNLIVGKYIPEHLSEEFFKYYDFHVHGEDIRLECRKKLRKIEERQEEEKKKNIKVIKNENLNFSSQMLKTLQNNLINRDKREKIGILIVEDQLFSRKLLMGALSQNYQCHAAKNASEALTLYALHTPDIVFLDIELPDMDGHTLANLFRKADNDAYIVMVTGNHYEDDIKKAKTNKVKGFIVKPYSRQKIMDSINKFDNARKKRI